MRYHLYTGCSFQNNEVMHRSEETEHPVEMKKYIYLIFLFTMTQ